MTRRRHAHADEQLPRRRRSPGEQLEGLALFDQPLGQTLPVEPRRTTLPPSEPFAPGSEASEDAADRLSRSGRGVLLEQRTLLAYARVHPRSLTADECADRLEEHFLSIRPRTSKLLSYGWLERTDEKRPSVTGSPQHALIATDRGLAEARRLTHLRGAAA